MNPPMVPPITVFPVTNPLHYLKKSAIIAFMHDLLNLTINFVFMYKILKVVNLNLHSACLPYVNGFKVLPTKNSHIKYIYIYIYNIKLFFIIKSDYLL